MNEKNLNTEPHTVLTHLLHSCQDVIAHLGDFVDRELPPEQRAAIESHLDECPDCAAFHASYKHVVTTAAELRESDKPLSVDVQNRLRSKLNETLGINLPLIA
jgi:anti-sigma factor RsiW